MPILRIFLLILVILAAAGGYLFYTKGAGLPVAVSEKIPFLQTASGSASFTFPAQLPGQLASLKIPSLPENTGDQLEAVSERTGEVGATVGHVLGTAIKEASPSANASLQERAFDYGRYLYCQQVVKDYEARTQP
jgi:hypothetical protein